MPAALPARMKSAGLQPFATRAAQLEKPRPIVWYWCEYYILQQILGKQLHLGDDECQTYAIQLMDKLEAYKTSNAANDAITDDVAAKAYIENFALETFGRADESQRANKVTRQTADTFQAAATFIDLLGIWGQLEAEMTAKSRFAKYHAVRIAKALKAGEDPNATNPKVEEPGTTGEVGVDDELKALEQQQQQQNRSSPGKTYLPPSVEDAPRPDSSTPNGNSPSNISLPVVRNWSEASQTMPRASSDQHQQQHDVSPIEQSDSHVDRQGSIGGGYFPSVPDAPSTDTLMSDADRQQDPPIIGSQPTTHQQQINPGDFYTAASTSGNQFAGGNAASPIPRPDRSPPEEMNARPPAAPSVQTPSAYQPAPSNHVPFTAPAPSVFAPLPAQPQGQQQGAPGGYRTDDESVLAAQKHAKWAISALNFEDVDTAVKELRIALQSLGAT